MQSAQPIAPTSLALLLRLDRPDLAARLWQAPESVDLFKRIPSREADRGSWLATAATAWLGTAYWRLVGAFEQADDQEAVNIAESLLHWQSQLPTRQLPDISFLSPVPRLLADSRRRLRQPTPKPPQTDHIATLIDQLETVQGFKIAIPGPLFFSMDPVYKSLTKEGDAAIAPLLAAYEYDQRLTRTFDYSRPWSLAYTPVPVSDVAAALLADILQAHKQAHGKSRG